MEFARILSFLFAAALLLLVAGRIVEQARWSLARRRAVRAGHAPADRYAVRLPLWTAGIGSAGCLTAIVSALGACAADGSLTLAQMTAIIPLFAASLLMVLVAIPGFYDVEVDCAGPGHLTFRRGFVAYRRIRVARVRFGRMRAGTLFLFVPNRKRPFPVDNFAHGFGRLMSLLEREHLPLTWELPVTAVD